MRFDSTPYYHLVQRLPVITKSRLTRCGTQAFDLLEQGGFTTVWIAEHHCRCGTAGYGTSPNR